MPQGSDYIFALQTKDHRFWKVVDRNVTVNAQPYFLEFAPAGWMDIAVQNIRNKKYWGIDRSVTIPLTYVQDGSQMLKYIFLNKGIEESVYLVILEQQLDYEAGVGYTYWYKQRFRGEIDLSTYNHDGSSVKVSTLEDGLPKYLKANENTVIEIPMDVADAINVKMDGIKLHNSVENVITDGASADPIYDFGNHLIDLQITKEDAPYVSGKQEVERTKVSNNNTLIQATGNWFSKPSVQSTIEIEYDFPVTITYHPPPGINPAGRYRIAVRKINTGGVGTNPLVLLDIPANQITGSTRRLTGSGSFVADADDELYLFAYFDVEGATGDAQIQTTYPATDNSFFNYKYKTRSATTYIKAFRPQYLFTKFIDFVTEGTYTADTADYFDRFLGNGDVVFTCGNALRGFDDAVLKWSWNDFFQFWDCFSSVGIYEKSGVVYFSDRVDMNDETDIIDLAEPSKLIVSPATDFLFNELEIGYPEIKNDLGVLNGNEAFNMRYLFSMGMTKRPAKMEKISKIAADPYVIEQVRITTLNKDTTDYKADNDVFALHLANPIMPSIVPGVGEVWELDRSLNATATGLIEPDTVFNIGLSPKLNFKRNGPWIRSSTWLMDTRTLKYQSSDKNNKLEFTDPTYGAIVEKGDENIGGLGDQFFVPVVLNITVPSPLDLISLLDSNPLQVIRFPFYGDYYTCIMLESRTSLSTNKEQQWALLPLPSTNLKKLEDYYG